jgi:hypothetical protein
MSEAFEYFMRVFMLKFHEQTSSRKNNNSRKFGNNFTENPFSKQNKLEKGASEKWRL